MFIYILLILPLQKTHEVRIVSPSFPYVGIPYVGNAQCLNVETDIKQ